MKQTRILMGMPITIEIVDISAGEQDINEVFSYFKYTDEKISVYKKTSEITQINNGKIKKSDWSEDMKIVFALSKETKIKTSGYFDIMASNGRYDPSGLVKGWAIFNASKILERRGFNNFYIEAGGDVQVRGKNQQGQNWKIGIRNPFNAKEIIKTVSVNEEGVATSGTYIRGQHIYDPKKRREPITEIISLTVIGPNIYEADRFATAAFAMAEKGIEFIENLPGFEGYVIDKNGLATMTNGFEKYTKNYA
ncbi:MAG: FAD:protein FMN transferase [Ignavibacteriae bacterium]|nr:FAD:protein FMN transferase [Ignavibacteriota bacterium]